MVEWERKRKAEIMPELRARKRRETEEVILAAATELFLSDGYARTPLSAVAKRAGVADRTVYVRFATKAKLFQRVIEAATVGDTDTTPLTARSWSRTSMSAATLDERIDAFCDGVSRMHERLGPLMAVNAEVEAGEPSVRASADAARSATIEFLRTFWELARQDDLLPASIDLDWLVDTTVILSAAETRLIISRHLGWDREAYRAWLATTFRRLITGAADADP